ncbi:MAG TPA: LacI family DNA-binding transcriptional regulator [bacterium]|nr:LacI family DNA-binding transcriptional regulator [bacterium]
MLNSRSRATLKQIAKYCGVSHTTVSMVINQNPRISAETRTKVLEAIKKFNYYPNVAARSLVMSRTNTIGIFGTMFDSPYYNEIIRGIEMECRHANVDLKIYNCNGSLEEFNDIYDRILGERRIDAVIALSVPMEDAVLERFQKEELPLIILQPVALEGPNHLLEKIPTLQAEDRKGIYKAVAYLLSLDHKRVGFVNGPEHLKICQDRLSGYRDALRDHGIPFQEQNVVYSHFRPDPFTLDAGYQLGKELLEKNPDLTAICCVSDTMAIGVIKAARHKGKAVPQDLSIIGFDDTYVARLADPSLTTLHQPLLEMGKASVNIAHSILNGTPIEYLHRGFDVDLIIRESTGKPRKK